MTDQEGTSGPLVRLDEAVCWHRLADRTFGRLAVDDDLIGRISPPTRLGPTILPVNYVVDDRSLVFRTGAGTKLRAAIEGNGAALEIDEIDPSQRTGWSVVVRGYLSEVEGDEAVRRARSLAAVPYAAGERHAFIRLTPVEVTGFEIAVMPDRERDPSKAPDIGHVWLGIDAGDLLG